MCHITYTIKCALIPVCGWVCRNGGVDGQCVHQMCVVRCVCSYVRCWIECARIFTVFSIKIAQQQHQQQQQHYESNDCASEYMNTKMFSQHRWTCTQNIVFLCILGAKYDVNPETQSPSHGWIWSGDNLSGWPSSSIWTIFLGSCSLCGGSWVVHRCARALACSGTHHSPDYKHSVWWIRTYLEQSRFYYKTDVHSHMRAEDLAFFWQSALSEWTHC